MAEYEVSSFGYNNNTYKFKDESARADIEELKQQQAQQVSSAVSDWLDENISQPAEVVIDKSLTIEGAAADAKAVGDFKSALSGILITKEKTLVNKSEPYTGSSSSWNMQLGATAKAGTPYTVEITVSASQNSDKALYWRASGENVGMIGYIAKNTTYAKFENTSPSKDAVYLRINGPITNATYTVKITYIETETIIEEMQTDIDNIQSDVAEIQTDINKLEISPLDVLPYRMILPSYYFGMLDNPLSYAEANQYMDGIIDSVPNGKHLLFVTDVHWPTNVKYSNYMLQYVRGKLGVKTVIFGGDVLNRSADKYKAKQVLCDYFNQGISAFEYNLLPAWGNHDLNTANATDLATERMDVGVSAEIFTKHLDGKVVFETTHNYGGMTGSVEEVITSIVDDKIESSPTILETLGKTHSEVIESLLAYNRLHYHFDDNANQIRYIIYNTGCPNNNIVSSFFGVSDLTETYLQVNWFYNVLMSTPNGYDIIVCGHEALYKQELNENLVNSFYMRSIISQLSALKKKVSATIWTDTDLTSIPSKWMPLGTQTVNFSNAPDVGKIVLLTGHWHQDFAGKGNYTSSSYTTPNYSASVITNLSTVDESNGEILLVCTRCDKQDNNELVGTPNEQAFDIVTLTDSEVVLTRMGYSANNVRVRSYTIT